MTMNASIKINSIDCVLTRASIRCIVGHTYSVLTENEVNFLDTWSWMPV